MYSAFVGCSYTQGVGLAKESADPNLWVNIVHSALLPTTSLLNLGLGGSTNDEIFCKSVDTVLNHKCQYLFVQWSELNRIKLNPGVETYPTNMFWTSNNTQRIDITVNPGITYNKKYIDDIKHRFFDLQHEHYAIVKILEYSKLVKKLCDQFKITVFFVNGILPWDKNYFDHVYQTNRLPSDTTNYTQTQLNASTRNDDEYFVLYDKIHSAYKDLHFTLDHWLNLHSGFRECFYLDLALDNLHPGIVSNQKFADHLIENLRTLIVK